jgi:hypothetical protein
MLKVEFMLDRGYSSSSQFLLSLGAPPSCNMQAGGQFPLILAEIGR